MMAIRFGADRLAADPGLLGNVWRVGLATNDAARPAIDARQRTRATLLAAGIPLVRLFSPEHGLGADAADGVSVADGIDALTKLPIVSLYGDRFAPPPESLSDLDAVLFDVPDVGVRFYTYTWTLTHLIDACAAARRPLFVLDRPNPLGGALAGAEGPLLDSVHASFIGRHTIPIRHALTLGELAKLWRNERCPDADVRVIVCEGWRREQLWSGTGLPFVPTSPAITTFTAALCYAGLCLFEATNLSVGRGSPLSFEAIGAPWLDAAAVAARFHARGIGGVDVACVRFTPGSGPHAGQACEGVRITATDAGRMRPVMTGLALLADVMALHRDAFEWATYPTAANPSGRGHFERLLGVSGVRAVMQDAPASIDAATLRAWTDAPGWPARWQSVRIYA